MEEVACCTLPLVDLMLDRSALPFRNNAVGPQWSLRFGTLGKFVPGALTKVVDIAGRVVRAALLLRRSGLRMGDFQRTGAERRLPLMPDARSAIFSFLSRDNRRFGFLGRSNKLLNYRIFHRIGRS